MPLGFEQGRSADLRKGLHGRRQALQATSDPKFQNLLGPPNIEKVIKVLRQFETQLCQGPQSPVEVAGCRDTGVTPAQPLPESQARGQPGSGPFTSHSSLVGHTKDRMSCTQIQRKLCICIAILPSPYHHQIYSMFRPPLSQETTCVSQRGKRSRRLAPAKMKQVTFFLELQMR